MSRAKAADGRWGVTTKRDIRDDPTVAAGCIGQRARGVARALSADRRRRTVDSDNTNEQNQHVGLLQ
jgi:hypothetical protein